MANSLSEGFARITYVGGVIPHHQILPLNYAGTPTQGVEPDLQKKDGTSVGGEAGIISFLTVWKQYWSNAMRFGLCEFYTVDPDTEERTFIYAFDLNTVGSSGAANVPRGMATFSFKTIKGGILKLVAMGGVLVPIDTLYPPFTPASNEDDLAQYITGADSVVIGRDNAYAFAPISVKVKFSDALGYP